MKPFYLIGTIKNSPTPFMSLLIGLIFYLALCSQYAQADALDDLLAQSPTLDKVLAVIAPNGRYSIEELISFKKRAATYFPAISYRRIMKDGLESRWGDYNRATSELVFDTFEMYLSKDPPPPIWDVLALIQPNGILTPDQLMRLKRQVLRFRNGVDVYPQVLRDGLDSTQTNYQKQTCDLLMETFDSYLEQRPQIQHVLALIKPNGKIQNDVLIALKMKALRLFWSASGNPSDFFAILRDGITHSQENYRALTFQLLSEKWEGYLEQNPPLNDLLIIIKSKGNCAIPFSPSTRAYFLREYLKLFQERAPLSRILQFMTPNNYFPTEFLIAMKEIAIQHYGSQRDFEQIVADCAQATHQEYREACQKLVYQNAKSYLESKPPITDALQRLRELPRTGVLGTPAQEQYELYISGLSRERLNQDLQCYYEKLGNSRPAVAEEPESKMSSGSQDGSAIQCPVCLESTPSDAIHAMKSCGHSICKNCLKSYLKEKIRDHAYPIRCIQPDCQGLITQADLEDANLSAPDISSYETAKLRHRIKKIPGASFCSTALCPDAFIPLDPVLGPSKPKRSRLRSLFFKQPVEDHHRVCRTCQSNQCLRCGRVHTNLSCEKFKKIEGASEKLITENMKNGRYKYCPNCQILTEKVSGCDHMNCRRCHHQYYWSNLKPY